MRTPPLSSMLLASTNPDRLRTWYEQAFDATTDPDGFVAFGSVAVLFDQRDDVRPTTVEPARFVLNFEVSSITVAARQLDQLGAEWVSPVEYRDDAGAWFGTVTDPDGNYVQLIELTHEYWTKRRARHGGAATARGPLTDAHAATRLPAQDLDRARRWYAEKLGLEPAEERDGGLSYECGGTNFVVFQSSGQATGEHTQMGFYIADIEAAVNELRQRGVEFMEVDAPGLRTVNGIADIEGQYPSSGASGERGAWFHDSEGNLLGLGQLVFAEE